MTTKTKPPSATAATAQSAIVPKKDRVVALMKGAECIRHSRLVNQSYGFSEFKSSDEAAVKRKLNDRSLYIGEIDIHPHDHPLGVEWNLQPGDSLVEVEFCKVDEPMSKPTSFFRWFVQGEKTATSKKPTL